MRDAETLEPVGEPMRLGDPVVPSRWARTAGRWS